VVSRNPFTIRLLGDMSGDSMTTQENPVSEIKAWMEEVGDPIHSWNFDLFVGDKPLWLVNKVKVDDGRMTVGQVITDSGGVYDLSGKVVRVVYYTEVPSILAEIEFSLGSICDVNLSCDASGSAVCADIATIYECKFVSMTNNCKKVSA
jgi:hypothetical protein